MIPLARALAVVALLGAAPAGATPVEFVPVGATWKYLDDGSDQGTAWRAVSFPDGGWASGPAQLGYGDGDEATVVNCGACTCPCSPKYTTTYLRHSFDVADPTQVAQLTLSLLRDDGAVVYLNGTEVFRSNMDLGTVDYLTFASTTQGGVNETTFFDKTVAPSLLVAGTNVLAVEVHQANLTSSDLSLDLRLHGELCAAGPLVLTRGPYLQSGTPSSAVVRWRTQDCAVGRVSYGTDPGALTSTIDGPNATEHEIQLTGLSAATRYYYSIGAPAQLLAGGDLDHYLETAPPHGTLQQTRIWVIGDSGQANQVARDVRDDYLAYTGSIHTDVWLMLGDNAYTSGTDAQYQAAVFDTYPMLLRNAFLWPTFGNHDAVSAFSAGERGVYYDVFTLPRTDPAAGGLPSGTEAYYSFDWANIHFIVLDSMDGSLDPLMRAWTIADLASTTQEWVIAYFHHPPYTKGTHDSDNLVDSGGRLIDMRELLLPLLEDAGVDLVLAGHSHVYERSMLIDGHYGFSPSFGVEHQIDDGDGCICSGGCPECAFGGDGPYLKPTLLPTGHEGTVYAVVGSSSSGPNTGPQVSPHPVMVVGLERHGAMVIDVDGARLDAIFIEKFGQISDRFTLLKGGDSDGDLVPDPDDLCPYTADPGQLDSGSILEAGPDGIGDVCQCGDVSDDGHVRIDDAARLARAQAAAAPPLPAPERCNVIGPTDPADPDLDGVPNDCLADDLATLRDALAALGGLGQLCAPAVP